MGYTGGARGGLSFTLQCETKLFSQTVHSAMAGTTPIAPTAGAGGAMTMWHSTQLPAGQWSRRCHTITIALVNTSAIHRTETMIRQIRVGSGIASDPVN